MADDEPIKLNADGTIDMDPQKVIDEVADTVVQTAERKTAVSVEEHDISEADAQKYASAGDYETPISPIDELIGTLGADVKTKADSAQPVSLPQRALEGAPELTQKDALSSQLKPDTAQPMSSADLERQAKMLLSDMDDGHKQKKSVSSGSKKPSGAATKMALAALLVVLMGAGGVVGMNLVKLNSENRSQAASSCGSGYYQCNLDAKGTKGCCHVGTGTKCDPKKGNCDTTKPSGTSGDVGSTNNTSSSGGGTNGGCGDGWFRCNTGCCGTGGGAYDGQRKGLTSSNLVTWTPSEINSILSKKSSGQLTTEEAEKLQAYNDGLKANGLVNDNGTLKLTTNAETDAAVGANSKLKEYCYPNGTLDTSKCRIVTGGYLYVGGLRDGSACAPVLSKGGDWCTVVNSGVQATCESLGLIRCICNNKVGVIGSAGQSCDNLCGGTNNVCESCNKSTPTPTPTPTPTETSIACKGLIVGSGAPKVGESVSITCNASGTGINHYEFRYKVGDGEYQSLTASSNTASLTVSSAGTYTAQCRVCKSSDSSDCTTWGMAQ